MSARTAVARTVGAALVAVLATGCGSPGSTTPVRIEPTEVPYGLLDAPTDPLAAAATGSDVPDARPSTPVFLLGPDGTVLQPAPAAVAGGAPEQVAAQVLDRLESGPTDAELAEGLGSNLGAVGLSLEGIEDGTARVEVELTAGDIAADQVPFALGQVVLTLTAVDGIDRVQIVSGGEPVEMALPGGALTTAPVTAADYEPLTVPGRPG
jgi:spore germination protein GerM